MNLWITDDEIHFSRGLAQAFTKDGFEVRCFSTLGALRGALEKEAPDIVLLDQRLPDGHGVDEISNILRASPDARVIMMTAFGEASLIVKAIRQGAFNYLDKPFPLDAARRMAEQARESLRLLAQSRSLARGPVPMIGSSPAMLALGKTLNRLGGQSELTILLQGESGSGKEVVARAAHRLLGSGAKGGFIPVNCAAIPEALLEAELFGYRKGAFTGAASDRAGLIELANEGTLFLDEIGDMPMNLQSKLLRFLDGRTVRPLGASAERAVKLNIVCATSQNLKKKTADGSFRKDLFYRISVLPLYVPPLRERERDALELAGYFLEYFASRRGRKPKSLSEEVESLFLSYPWPGNVRELKNLIEHLTLLSDPEAPRVLLKDIPEHLLEEASEADEVHKPNRPDGVSAAPGGLVERLEAFERSCLLDALESANGNRGVAAEALGISRFSLLRRLQRHGLA